MSECGLYLSFAQQEHKFCACATNGIEWPVESFECEIIDEARHIAITGSNRHEAASHGGLHSLSECAKLMYRKRKTYVQSSAKLSSASQKLVRNFEHLLDGV